MNIEWNESSIEDRVFSLEHYDVFRLRVLVEDLYKNLGMRHPIILQDLKDNLMERNDVYDDASVTVEDIIDLTMDVLDLQADNDILVEEVDELKDHVEELEESVQVLERIVFTMAKRMNMPELDVA